MARVRRSRERILGAARAQSVALAAGAEVRSSRLRRGMRQVNLAAKAGISQARLAEIEAGKGGGAPLEVWLAIAAALDRYLRFEFARDPLVELVDAGHLAIQELVIRVATAAGWEAQFEAPSPGYRSSRSVDVRLIDRKSRRIVIVECWNT